MLSRVRHKSRRRSKRSGIGKVQRPPATLTLEGLVQRQLLSVSADWFVADGLADEGSGTSSSSVDSVFSDASVAQPPGMAGDLYSPVDVFELSDNQVVQSTSDPLDQTTTTNQAAEDTLAVGANAAEYTLYLEFEGGRVYSRPGDFWLGSDYIDINGYDLSQYGWGGHEAESINYIANFVSEDYAAYNVSVTTTEPATGEYTTIYVGGDNSWFNGSSNVIGLASYDVGNRDASNFGFAFTEELTLYYNHSGGSLLAFSEYVANLVSHEAAHTFGADHVSDTSALMNPYLTLSPRTLMFGNDDEQDTETLLAENVGYAHGSDDFGDDQWNAATLTAAVTTTGLLEKRSDQDVFTFTAEVSGTATVGIETTAFGNLDSQLTIYRVGETTPLVQNDDYAGGLDSLVSFGVEAGGDYLVYVSSSTGNSSGSYSVALELPEGTPQLYVRDSVGASDDRDIDLGIIGLGQTEHTASIIIGNSGSADLVISELQTDWPFEIDLSSLLGNSADDIIISAGGEQVVTVTFDPTAAGLYNAELTLTTNDNTNPLVTCNLTATARQSEPDIAISGSGGLGIDDVFDFGNLNIATAGSTTIVIENYGWETLTVSQIDITEPFVITTNLNGSEINIAPGEQFELTVSVSGQQRATLDGLLTIVSNDPDEQSTEIDLTAEVVGGLLTVQGPYGSIDTGVIDFGDVYVGEDVEQIVTLTNSGEASLLITDITIDGTFTLAEHDDLMALAPGESTNLTIHCNPTGAEFTSGTLSITTQNTESSAVAVEMWATGLAGGLEIHEVDGLDDGLLDAGRMASGESHNIPAWTITNNGNGSRTISLGIEGAQLAQLVTPDTIVVGPGQSYTIQLAISPDTPKGLTDSLTLNTDVGLTGQLALTGQGYAVVGNGEIFRFTDHTGDGVIVMLTGGAQGQLTLGIDGQPDIESLHLQGNGASANLMIIVTGSGTTELGELTGTCNLSALNGWRVNLAGAGIDLAGSVDQLTLASVVNGADINFQSNKGSTIRISNIDADTNIDVDGAIQTFMGSQFLDGSLEADSIGFMMLDELGADIDVLNGDLKTLMVRQGDLSGDINVNGSVGNVTLFKGDLLGSLTAQADIGRIFLSQGTVRGEVNSAATIGNILAGNIDRASITALNGIDSINVLGNMRDSTVDIGTTPAGQDGAPALAVGQSAPYLGNLSVRGTYASSTIAVGVSAEDADNLTDTQATADSGTIRNVSLNKVETHNSDAAFGLIARSAAGSLRVGYHRLDWGYNLDDFYALVANKG